MKNTVNHKYFNLNYCHLNFYIEFLSHFYQNFQYWNFISIEILCNRENLMKYWKFVKFNIKNSNLIIQNFLSGKVEFFEIKISQNLI